jgi:hypothetical protein
MCRTGFTRSHGSIGRRAPGRYPPGHGRAQRGWLPERSAAGGVPRRQPRRCDASEAMDLTAVSLREAAPKIRVESGPSSRLAPDLAGQDHQARVCGCAATDAEAAGRSALADDLCAAAECPARGGRPGQVLQARSPRARWSGHRLLAGAG